MLEFRIDFDIIREIKHSETIARGSGIRELNRLRKIHGPGNWRKRKGYATVRLPDGSTCIVEIHWYEATSIGEREIKIKRYMDITS